MTTPHHEVIVTPENMPALILLHKPGSPDVVPHWHESLELICSLDSRLRVHYGQEKTQINEYDVAVVNCCQIHSVVPLRDYRNHGISITFGADFLKKHSFDAQEPFFVLEGNDGKRREIADDMKKIFDFYSDASPDPYSNFLVNSLLFHITYCLFKYFLISPSIRAKTPEGKYQKRYWDIMNYIREHYAEPITLNDVAVFSNLSKEHLSREFKTHVGEGFRDYLNSVRIEKAQYELLYTDAPLIEVAIKNGFSDLRSYNRAFQKLFEMSPVQYRRTYRRNLNDK